MSSIIDIHGWYIRQEHIHQTLNQIYVLYALVLTDMLYTQKHVSGWYLVYNQTTIQLESYFQEHLGDLIGDLLIM